MYVFHSKVQGDGVQLAKRPTIYSVVVLNIPTCKNVL